MVKDISIIFIAIGGAGIGALGSLVSLKKVFKRIMGRRIAMGKRKYVYFFYWF